MDLYKSKEIIIKPNKDGTYNIQVKKYILDESTNTFFDGIVTFHRANIKLEIESLSDTENEFTGTMSTVIF